MSTRIYKEAIDEANDLIRMAEENAKKKLVEAFAPRIRAMVEKSLFESSEENSGGDDIDDLLLSMEDEEEQDEHTEAPAVPPMLTPPSVGQSFPAQQTAGVDLHVPAGVKSVTLNLKEESAIDLTNESLETLLRIVDGSPTVLDRSKSLRLELKMLGRALNALNENSTSKGAAIQIVEEFNAILRKSIGLKQELQESNSDLSESARIEFSNLLKEIEHMSTRTLLRNLLRESSDFNLYEADEEQEEMDTEMEEMYEADEEAPVDEEMPAEEEAPAEDPAAQLSDIIAQLQALSAEMGGESEEEEPAEEEEAQEEGEMHGEMEYEGEDLEENETVYEIDESTIARALMEARKRRGATKKLNAESDMAHHFGGGSKAKDVKLNALSEKDKAGKKKPVKPEAAVKGMTKAETAHMKEARYNRASDARLNEAVQAAETLRRQLDEQKLFNAKLLYVNKLLNNRSLSEKQLKSVVEAIDSAKTIREAKLLYTSLSESLVTTGGRLAEGARSAGGSSRPVRTSQRLDESAGEVNRWAVLAGIAE